MPTKKGYELAEMLAHDIGYTRFITDLCSRICRTEATLNRLTEDGCNGHPIQSRPARTDNAAHWALVDKLQAQWDARVDRETERAEKRLVDLVAQLPETDDGPYKVDLSNGLAGKIVRPDGSWIGIP